MATAARDVKNEEDNKRNIHIKETLGKDLLPVKLLKSPPLIELKGIIANTHSDDIHSKIFAELTYVKENSDASLVKYLDVKFDKLLKDNVNSQKYLDPAILTLSQGYFTIRILSGEADLSLQRLQSLCQNIDRYKLAQPHIVCSLLYYHIFRLYMSKRKHNIALKCLQSAKYSLQMAAPSEWTGRIYHIQAMMCETYAQLYPSVKDRYHKLAAKSYRLAREHLMNHPYKNCEGFANAATFYLLKMFYTTLDFPTPNIVTTLRQNDIHFDPIVKCKLTESDIARAEDMLLTAERDSKEFKVKDFVNSTHERVHIGKIYLEMRRARVLRELGDLNKALESVEQATHLCSLWSIKYTGLLSVYEKTPGLSVQITEFLHNIEQDIHLKLSVKDGLQSPQTTSSVSPDADIEERQ